MSSEGGPEMTGIVGKFVIAGDQIVRSEPDEGPVFHAELEDRLSAGARSSESTLYRGIVTERGGRKEIETYPELDDADEERVQHLVREAFSELDWDAPGHDWRFE